MRAAKLAMARKMLKEHQEKKQVTDEKLDDESPAQSTSPCFLYTDVDESEYVINPDVPQYATSMETNVKITEPMTDVLQTNKISEALANEYKTKYEEQLKAVELLTSSKRQLEIQVQSLQDKIKQIELNCSESKSNFNMHQQEMSMLQTELNNIKENNISLKKDLDTKNDKVDEQMKLIASLMDKNNDLSEQLDITKTALMARQAEVGSLQSHNNNLQIQVESTELRLQQLSHGETKRNNTDITANNIEDIDILLRKVTSLEQQLKSMLSEKQLMKVHYEQYVKEMDEQVNYFAVKNGDLVRQNHVLSNRETELIEQISNIEIKMQEYIKSSGANMKSSRKQDNKAEIEELKQKCQQLEEDIKGLQVKYEESVAEVDTLKKLQEEQKPAEPPVECTHMAQDINLSKLHADIASDKIAAQLATTQNIQLKNEIEHLKEVYIKMSQDKLELTEKLDAEKFLNRQLTLKLSEIDEKAKETHTKLMAKDKEMIRLISSYNEIEQKMKDQTNKINAIENDASMLNHSNDCINKNSNGQVENDHCEDATYLNTNHEEPSNALNISIKEGMLRLQDSFLKKMSELAELSDEKHRLEHIIMQLQSETDTICEYVALYQQQRGILKKREQERKMQLKFLEVERKKMKFQLNILNNIIQKFASDEALKEYFEKEQRQKDVSQIMNLIGNLKKSYLINESKQLSDMNFYHCSWCSGKVIDV